MVNASPLLLLAKIGQLDLLERLSPEFLVPQGVLDEIEAGPDDDPARKWATREGAARGIVVGDVDRLVAAWDLGKGESEVLTWAHVHTGYEAILDDGAARKCADALQVPVRGVLGVLLLAKREGLLVAIRPLIDQLLEVEYRIALNVVQTALRLAGE